MARKATPPAGKTVEALRHAEATRRNIPTAEYQSVLKTAAQAPVRVAYERRNRDLDPQLVWRGKDEQAWSDLVVHAPPLYIQEKLHPKALIDDLLRQTRENRYDAGETTPDAPRRPLWPDRAACGRVGGRARHGSCRAPGAFPRRAPPAAGAPHGSLDQSTQDPND